MSNPPHWLTSAELTEALQYATGSLRLTAAIVMARELLAERAHAFAGWEKECNELTAERDAAIRDLSKSEKLAYDLRVERDAALHLALERYQEIEELHAAMGEASQQIATPIQRLRERAEKAEADRSVLGVQLDGAHQQTKEAVRRWQEAIAIAEDFNHQRVEAARQRDRAAAAERAMIADWIDDGVENLSIDNERFTETRVRIETMEDMSDQIRDGVYRNAAAIRTNADKEG